MPKIWPWKAKEAGARVVATGRSDFPNQVNNSLAFPSIFRGVLDVRAKTITDGMAVAAAEELARFAEEKGFHEDYIIPSMGWWEVYPRVAAATAVKTVEEGVARLKITYEEEYERAKQTIEATRSKALKFYRPWVHKEAVEDVKAVIQRARREKPGKTG